MWMCVSIRAWKEHIKQRKCENKIICDFTIKGKLLHCIIGLLPLIINTSLILLVLLGRKSYSIPLEGSWRRQGSEILSSKKYRDSLHNTTHYFLSITKWLIDLGLITWNNQLCVISFPLAQFNKDSIRCGNAIHSINLSILLTKHSAKCFFFVLHTVLELNWKWKIPTEACWLTSVS